MLNKRVEPPLCERRSIEGSDPPPTDLCDSVRPLASSRPACCRLQALLFPQVVPTRHEQSSNLTAAKQMSDKAIRPVAVNIWLIENPSYHTRLGSQGCFIQMQPKRYRRVARIPLHPLCPAHLSSVKTRMVKVGLQYSNLRLIHPLDAHSLFG